MNHEILFSYPSLGFFIISTLFLLFCWKDYYFIYNHRVLFLVGLVFSRSLAYYAIVDIFMWYLTDHDVAFVKSTVLSNILDSLSSLFVIFMANSADSFVGLFRTLVFSTTAYISGIMLLVIFNPYDVTWLLVIMLILLALGRSGDPILENLLTHLVDEIDNSVTKNKKRSYARAKIWWRIAHVCGAISALMWVAPLALGGTKPTWKSSFWTCLITISATFIIFCVGHKYYPQGALTERPVEIFFRVIRTRIQKLLDSKSRCSTKTSTQEISPETRNLENDGITPKRSPPHLDANGQEERGSSSYEKDVKVIRSLLRMFPMWGTFFVVSLTSAAGSTFFYEQYNNLENRYDIPAVQIYAVSQDLTRFAIPFLYQKSCLHKYQRFKIGAGMLCSIISCVCAWQLEVHRLKEVHSLGDDDDVKTSISCLWLLPQFFLIGCMEGLTEKGFLELFKSQVDRPIANYGEEYMEFVMCLGKIVNIALILILRRWHGWFSNDINHGTVGTHLNKYYILLVYICSVNLIFYSCIAKFIYTNKKQDDDSDHEDFRASIE